MPAGPFRPAAPVLLCGALAACAGGAEPGRHTPQSDAAGDALVGAVRDDAAPIELPGGPCTPGTTLALCHVCNAEGRPALPADDPACPAPDCGLLATFRRVSVDDAEEVRCERVPYGPPEGLPRCTAPGQCLVASAAICTEAQEPDPVETLAVDLACATLAGCEGATPPTVTPQPPGTPCHGAGTCGADGRCSVSARCAAFSGTRLCREEVVNDLTECELYVEAPFGEQTTCRDYCQSHGACCVDAWPEDATDPCAHDGRSNCSDRHGDLVCRCVVDPGSCSPDGGAPP